MLRLRLSRCRHYGSTVLAVFLLAWTGYPRADISRNLAIGEGEAKDTVKELSLQLEVEIIFAAGTAVTAQTNSVEGEFTAGEALKVMLRDTPLVAVPISGGKAYGILPNSVPAPAAKRKKISREKEDETLTTMKISEDNKTIKFKHLIGGLLTLGATTLTAQDVSENEEEDIFTLSPFQVDGSQDVGYRATATTAGSRLRTEMKDVAASITVLTNEFLDDLGANDISEALTMLPGADTDLTADVSDFTSNGSGHVTNDSNEREGSVRVRGLGRAVNTLNYVQVYTSLDRYNISRAEFLRGPNSILFGLGEAAGIVNYSPNRALLGRNLNNVQFKVDQFGSRRVALDFSRTIIEDKLAVRANVLDSSEKYMFDHAYWDDRRLFVTSQWKPFKNTTINAGIERVKSSGRRPNYTLAKDQSSGWLDAFNAAHADAADDDLVSTPNGPIPLDTFLADNMFWDPIARSVGNNSGNVPESPDLWSDRGGFDFEASPASYRINFDGGNVDLVTMFSPDNWNEPVGQSIFRASARNLSGGGASTGARRVNGVNVPGSERASHRRSLAQSADPKDGVNRAFTDPQVLDEAIFPYLDIDLASVPGNLREIKDEKFFFNFEQRINDDFYVQGTFQTETYDTYTRNVISNAHRQIAIDVNERLTDGRINENFLRPFISGRQDERFQETTSENIILQASYDLNFAEKTDNLAWLGRHQVSALYSKTNEDILRYSRLPAILNNDDGPFGQLEVNPSDNNFRRIRQVWYIGDPVQPGDSSVRFTGFPPSVAFDPSKFGSAGYNYYDSDNASEYLATNAIVENWERFDGPLNLGNVVNSNASYQSRNVEGVGLTLQSYFWNGKIATLFGVRQDSLEQFEHEQMTTDQFASQFYGLSATDLAAARERLDDGVGTEADDNLRDEADRLKWLNGSQSPEHFVISPEPLASFDDVETRSSGIVFHVTNNMRLFLNKSETFNLESPRRDNMWNIIPPQTGTTEEYGIGFQLFDNKLHMKLAFYESDSKNKSSSTSSLTVREIRNFENRFFAAARSQSIDPENEENPGTIALGVEAYDDRRTPEVESIFIHPMKGMERLDSGEVVFRDTVFRDEDGDLQGRYILPDNAAATEDTLSKGFEFESTFNPNRNLRISFNLSRLENTVTAIGPEIERYFDWRARDIFQAAALSLREGGSETTGILSGARSRSAQARASVLVIKRFNDLVATRYLLARERIGRSNPGISEYNARLTANYTFREGRFKGFSVGTNLRWESGKAIGYYLKDASFSLYDYLDAEDQSRFGDLSDLNFNRDADGNVISFGEEGYSANNDFNDNLPFRIPDADNPIESDQIVTGGVKLGYRTKIMNNKVDWRIQLNVQNLFKQGDDLRAIRVNPDDSIVYGINRPTTYQLTNSFSF